MTFDHGPLLDYEITWSAGNIETISAHQVLMPPLPSLFMPDLHDGPRRIMFHAEIDGKWQLLLAANDEDILSVRNVTNAAEDVR